MSGMAPSFEYRDGRMVEVPDVHISTDVVLSEPITRTLVISDGATVVARAPISGSVQITAGQLIAETSISGTVTVRSGSSASFAASMSGTLNVAVGGRAHIRPGATALGSMRIDGSLLNEGVRGVQLHGSGQVEDRGQVRQPDRTDPDGVVVYLG